MCFIPRNYHRNAAVYNATVYMTDGSFKKWRLSRLDAGHLYSLWNKPFGRIFNSVDLSAVDRIICRSVFSSEDDFVLS